MVCFIVLPAIGISHLLYQLGANDSHDRPQTSVPLIVGLTYETAQIKLRDANLNMRVLANRYDLPFERGMIIAQTPQGWIAALRSE
jgi:beta-lactam-binding protein with PASTA domain